jgi:hypothetical protein
VVPYAAICKCFSKSSSNDFFTSFLLAITARSMAHHSIESNRMDTPKRFAMHEQPTDNVEIALMTPSVMLARLITNQPGCAVGSSRSFHSRFSVSTIVDERTFERVRLGALQAHRDAQPRTATVEQLRAAG